MGVGPAAVQLMLELWQRGYFKNVHSVVELGSQGLKLPKAQFDELLNAASIPVPADAGFGLLEPYPNGPECPAQPFYRLLGVERYACVDLNGQHGAIRHDLNLPFDDPAHLGQYDLVTDHGTAEHAFNIAEAYRTVHRLCRTGGLILIGQMLYGGNGYYNFDPAFFEGMAAANGYKVIYCSYVVNALSNGDQFNAPIARTVLDVLDWGKVSEMGMMYVFEKQTSADFQFPYEGDYLTKAQGHYGFRLQFLPQPPSRVYVPTPNLNWCTTKELATLLLQRVIRKARSVVTPK